MDRKTPLIIVTGPTGAGKTSIVLTLAEALPMEVVSADSMQVYKHMDIATAKPTIEEQKMLTHHLIDIMEPDGEFNAGMFMSLADENIREIITRNKIPVVVGGTGLYIKALLHGLAPALPRSTRLRNYLKSSVHEKGCLHLWEALCRMDPEAADKINKKDALRIIRSLEILLLTGRRPSRLYHDHAFADERYEARILCIMPERERLYHDIDARVEAMIAAGLVGETENLLSLGFSRDLRSMQTLAYKHVISFLDAAITLDEAKELIRRDTRRYAKRQITWMRSHYDAASFHTPAEASRILSAWLREALNCTVPLA